MINLLIITDATQDWILKCITWIKDYSIRKTGSVIFITNPLIRITITPVINMSARGQRYNIIILDKKISDEIYQQILMPSLRGIIDLRTR